MWVFLSDAFLSIVAHRTKPGVLLVRARVRGDLERAFPNCRPKLTPAADYRYRAEISTDRVKAAITNRVEMITYDNFKNSVADTDRHEAYMRVWAVMHCYQSSLAATKRSARRRTKTGQNSRAYPSGAAKLRPEK